MKTNPDRKRVGELITKIIARNEKVRHAENAGRVSVGWPVYDEREVLGALDALLDLRISQGPRVKKFEEEFASYIGKKYAVAVNSGSSANLLALGMLLQAGKLNTGDEVIVPATTFATVASPVIQLGLIPVYVDVDPYTWNLDPKAIEATIGPKTKAIMAVHTFGNPADMKTLLQLKKNHDLIIIEDCCEAHGAAIGPKKVGSMGDLSTLSFFVAHNITTGEGGMIFTDDPQYYEILLSMREFGRFTKNVGRFEHNDAKLGNYDTRYIFTRLGYNVRMTDIEAALGLAQLKKLDRLNKKRIAIVEKYRKSLSKYPTLRMPTVEKGNFHSYYGFPFTIEPTASFSRMDLVAHLESRGIETRPFFGGNLPDQPAFREEPMRLGGDLTNAKYLRDHGVFIGCHPALTGTQVNHVLKAFADFFAEK